MNKLLTLVVLVLLVLVSAVGLRNLSANHSARPAIVSTGAPVPILPDDAKLVASTGAPVPILPDNVR
jgi:hypothetical protein